MPRIRAGGNIPRRRHPHRVAYAWGHTGVLSWQRVPGFQQRIYSHPSTVSRRASAASTTPCALAASARRAMRLSFHGFIRPCRAGIIRRPLPLGARRAVASAQA
eukprot:8984296-Lingulodinium_polyedra.AAC.1